MFKQRTFGGKHNDHLSTATAAKAIAPCDRACECMFLMVYVDRIIHASIIYYICIYVIICIQKIRRVIVRGVYVCIYKSRCRNVVICALSCPLALESVVDVGGIFNVVADRINIRLYEIVLLT